MHLQMRQYRSLLGTYLQPLHGRVLLLAGLLFGSISLQLLSPQVVRAFIDITQRGGPQQALLMAAVLFVGIALAQRGLALASIYVGEDVGWTATNALRSDLARHCLSLDLSFHKRHTPGELIERIDGDVTALANFFSQFVIQVLGNSCLVLGILVLLFLEDWRIGAALLVYTCITFGVLLVVQNAAVARWAASRQASAQHFGFLEERISGTEDIRANGTEGYIQQRLAVLMHQLLTTERAARLVSNITFITTNFVFVLGYAVGLGVGAYLYTQGQVSIGTAYLIVFYIGMLAAPLETIRAQVQDLQQATASIGRVNELFQLWSAMSDHGHTPLPPGALSVAFEDVRFGYDGAEPVLQDISFELKPGRMLGLLGRTGSGKTTLIRLLFRLYDPTAGAIRLSGLDLRDVPLAQLSERIGVVTQDVQLFHASIRDNLTFFDQTISDEAIQRVLQQLGLWSWVQALPGQLDAELMAGGQGLSAGEAQLLAFARVFLKDPGLVVLDEASSRLDPVTERLLEQAVERLLAPAAPSGAATAGARRTGIIIAHRLQTVLRADDIMILEQGRIVERGTREHLLADPRSRFNQLLQTGLEEVIA